MNDKQEIVLGFCRKIGSDEHYKISEDYLPSKIGGSPVFLIKDMIPDVTCNICKNKMKFLLQLYAPIDQHNAYHRSIYIFMCLKSKDCQQNVKALRCQLGIKNKYYDENEDKQKYYAQKNYVQKLNKSEYQELNQELLIETEIQENSDFKKQYRTAYNVVLDNKQQAIEDLEWEEAEGDEIEITDNEKVKELLDQYKNNKQQRKEFEAEFNDGDFDEAYNELQKNTEDDYFTIYQNMMNYEPENIIRYCRDVGSKPLYISSQNQCSKIENCQNCGSERIFEFQINNLYEVDWGIICVYSCKKNCDIEGYQEEFVYVQNYIEEIKRNRIMSESSSLSQIQEDEYQQDIQEIEQMNQQNIQNLKMGQKIVSFAEPKPTKNQIKNQKKKLKKLQQKFEQVEIKENDQNEEAKDNDDDDWS